jgi:hypothetical protein
MSIMLSTPTMSSCQVSVFVPGQRRQQDSELVEVGEEAEDQQEQAQGQANQERREQPAREVLNGTRVQRPIVATVPLVGASGQCAATPVPTWQITPVPPRPQ